MIIVRPDGTPITKWEDWTRPKRDYQWQPGRSAMELAKAWFRDGDNPSPPKELMELLSSHERLTGIELIKGTPELVTSLPEKGEGRNHDLHFLCKTPHERITLCIEAKADEPFGDKKIGEYWASAMKQRQNDVRTGVPERIGTLLGMVGENGFNPSVSSWADVRYQLLTAICGTAIQAKLDNSTLGILIVHEFQTDSTTPENLKRNANDFVAFLQNILGIQKKILSTKNLCPVTVSGVECLIGKVITVF
ncbi:DUF6946 family protein [Thermodesulfobacteriota bacterium]